MSRFALSLSLLALSFAAAVRQVRAADDDAVKAPVKWEASCAARGCLMQTEVLRGDSGDPPDKTDFHEYVGIDVAFERQTRKPAYFAFHVDPNAERDSGISIGFTKPGKATIDSDGTSKLDVGDCDEKSCIARVPLGLIKKGRNLNLLDKFLKADHVLVEYTRGGKQYRTMVPLSTFQAEYQLVLNELVGAGKK